MGFCSNLDAKSIYALLSSELIKRATRDRKLIAFLSQLMIVVGRFGSDLVRLAGLNM